MSTNMSSNTPTHTPTGSTTDVRHGAEVRPWSPWRDLAPAGARFEDLVDRLWSGLAGPADMTPAGALHEEESAFVVELDLPGVDKKDVTVEVADRRLTVSGTRQEKERQGILRHSTRVTGTFSYGALLPSPITEDAVTASMADGVLTITLPKADGSSTRKIDIA